MRLEFLATSFGGLNCFGIGKCQSMFPGERLRNLRGILWVSTRCMFWLLAVSRTQASYSPDVYPRICSAGECDHQVHRLGGGAARRMTASPVAHKRWPAPARRRAACAPGSGQHSCPLPPAAVGCAPVSNHATRHTMIGQSKILRERNTAVWRASLAAPWRTQLASCDRC